MLTFQVRIPEKASDRCHGCRRPHPHSPLRRSWPWLQDLKTGKYFSLYLLHNLLLAFINLDKLCGEAKFYILVS